MNKNYYDEVLDTLKELYEKKEYLKAQSIIEEELSMPYIPLDFEKELNNIAKDIKASVKSKDIILDDEMLEEYLSGDDYRQILAVNYLDSMNLRNYLPLINKYLIGNGNRECKCLLISSLIDQEINEEITVNKDGLEISFIPKYAEPIEMTDGYNSALNFIKEVFENENPVFFNMCKELLIKECFYNLPLAYDEEEGIILGKSVIVYLYECLDDQNGLRSFKERYISDDEMMRLYQFDADC